MQQQQPILRIFQPWGVDERESVSDRVPPGEEGRGVVEVMYGTLWWWSRLDAWKGKEEGKVALRAMHIQWRRRRGRFGHACVRLVEKNKKGHILALYAWYTGCKMRARSVCKTAYTEQKMCAAFECILLHTGHMNMLAFTTVRLRCAFQEVSRATSALNR
jgi:hypothetical protein